MEIIVFPYMAISFAIGWAIFSPFAEIDGLHQWTFARLETSDLLAIFIPVSLLLAFAIWATPSSLNSKVGFAFIVFSIGGYTFASLLAGLFLLAKMSRRSTVKRMAIIGVIIPIGAMLSVAWFALPLLASTDSVLYAIPATISVAPFTVLLRYLSGWSCREAVSQDK